MHLLSSQANEPSHVPPDLIESKYAYLTQSGMPGGNSDISAPAALSTSSSCTFDLEAVRRSRSFEDCIYAVLRFEVNIPICRGARDEGDCITEELAVAYALLCHMAKLYSEYCEKTQWIPAGALAVRQMNFYFKKMFFGFDGGRIAEHLRRMGGLAVARKLMAKLMRDIVIRLRMSVYLVNVGGMETSAVPCNVVRELACELADRLGQFI